MRDTQLGEDAHRYANRSGVGVFSFLRTVVMNLLRRGGYRSIRQGFLSWPTTSKGCWRWEGFSSRELTLNDFQAALGHHACWQ